MKIKELKSKFNQATYDLPQDLLGKGEMSNGQFSMQIDWAGGKMVFADKRGEGEFSLFVYATDVKLEFYQEYLIFSKDGVCDVDCLTDLANDLEENAAYLTLEDNVVLLSDRV